MSLSSSGNIGGVNFPFRAILLAIVTVVGFHLCAPAKAQAAPAEANSTRVTEACPRGNLLTRARAIASDLSQDRLARLTDRVVSREGAPWPRENLVVVVPGEITFDLGSIVSLEQFYLQLDADQAFTLELSADAVDWTRMPVSASATASGLIFRSFNLNHAAARFVKLSATAEPRTLTLAEVGVACQREAKVRQGLTVEGAALSPWESSWSARIMRGLTGAPAVSPNATNVVKLLLVVLATLLVCAELRRRGSTPPVAWALIGFAAVGAYLNFGAYRYPEFVHDHDVFHYFIGAKYFPELGYRSIYDCSAVAEAEAGFPERVAARAQRDLATNRIESGTLALARGADCPKHFGPQRWEAFRHDVGYFANGRSVPDWHRVLKDHGFNASPTWIALARVVVGSLPATEHTVGRRNAFEGIVGALDPLLLLASVAVIVWAFGLRTASIVAVIFACNPLSDFSWVGGGFLREAWLATLVIGLCLLKKARFVFGGACLALSALLQLLPLPALLLPLLGGALSAWGVAGIAQNSEHSGGLGRAKAWLHELARQHALWRVLGGAALSLMLFVPLSPWLTGAATGMRVWSAFASNTAKHEATPSGNLVGLSTLLSFRQSTTVDALLDPDATDPFARTRAAQAATIRQMRPVQGLIFAAALGLLAYALRRPRALWWSSSLGLGLVALALAPSCYYSAWLCAFALVGYDHERLLLPILAALVALLTIQLAVTQAAVQAASSSGVIVLAVVLVLLLIAWDRRGPSRDDAALLTPRVDTV